MTMAAAIESRTAEAPAWSKSSRIAGVDIFDDLSQAETIWRSLEESAAILHALSAVRFSCAHGNEQVGARENLKPFIVDRL